MHLERQSIQFPPGGGVTLSEGGRTMKRRLLSVICVALVVAMVAPTAAHAAFVWRHVGGDPLLRPGVQSRLDFQKKMDRSARVKRATYLVTAAIPAADRGWVRSQVKAKAANGDVHITYIKRGKKLRSMAYGTGKSSSRRGIVSVRNVVYRGQYRNRRLKMYYVLVSRTVTSGGYRITTSYRVGAAQKCWNVAVWDRKVTRVRIPDEPPPPVITEHQISVTATEAITEHVSWTHYRGYLEARITGHSDGDAIVSYRWNINGTDVDTSVARMPVTLEYNRVHLVTVTVTDALGHTAQYSLPPFNHQGPADPPQ